MRTLTTGECRNRVALIPLTFRGTLMLPNDLMLLASLASYTVRLQHSDRR